MRVIGLISGTSVDGIDAALVEISGTTTDLKVRLISGKTYPYSPKLRERILSAIAGNALSMAEVAALDDAIAQEFAQAALAIQADHSPADLIGSHGQTVYHRPLVRPNGNGQHQAKEDKSPYPDLSLAYSLQLGRGDAIAYLTGIPTVSNFRAADIALGGQGAPLVSPLDVHLCTHPTLTRCVQNIGGIGNVTYLPANQTYLTPPGSNPSSDQTPNSLSTSTLNPQPSVSGWDTGPGNTLLDLAVQYLSHGEKSYDHNGDWAATGTPCLSLVQSWLQQDFFQQPPPKSTGREAFGVAYLHRCLTDAAPHNLNSADLLATLTELTAASIVQSYEHFLPQMPDQVLVCGGGSRNPYLMQQLQTRLDPIPIYTTDAVGLNADFKEAIAFAVLAYWRIHNIPGNLPEVTGAREAVPLGEIHLVAKA